MGRIWYRQLMKDRIKRLMESQHMTQQTFADFIGISSASLSSIFNGRTKPTLNTVEAIKGNFLVQLSVRKLDEVVFLV